jgi:hypothetical protein
MKTKDFTPDEKHLQYKQLMLEVIDHFLKLVLNKTFVLVPVGQAVMDMNNVLYHLHRMDAI